MMKRLFDILFSLFGLLISSPLFAIVGAWIWLEKDGPIIFKQRRVGQHGKVFGLLKFRTMVPEKPGDRDIGVTMSGHPRVKRASGKFLRKTKLDELPQLINVLRGDMSFVGPRPEIERYVQHYSDDDRAQVLSVRPGITDLTAIKFSNEEAMMAGQANPEEFYVQKILPAKVSMYRDYVRNHSFLKDIGLILLTVLVLLVPALRRKMTYQSGQTS
jgi:lipopolysaccharide/colanic/teichoic acid biosynthesis glycosyltransferase